MDFIGAKDGGSGGSTGVVRMTRGMAILPRGNQEPLVVREKVGRPQVA